MSIINVLDTSVSNLIAAGEVVERPANAIKEMCENSIDAGAKSITVEIKNGGITYIRITDDGCGMSDEDAVLCVKRHATSKIKEASDLNKIVTLGFRGEALAAITAVSNANIITKRKEDDFGTSVRCEYGDITEIEEVGCPNGTTIICEKLFATTPARLKFLKSDSSETSFCNSVLERVALSHPEISFKFISDGNLRFSTSGNGNLKDAIYAIFGNSFTSKLAEVNSYSGGIGVNGYIGTPENYKGNRTNQIFFINHRHVKNNQLSVALESAFRTHIMVGRFPVCVLNIDINPAYVDVNIHPTKQEVKFSDEKKVFDAIYYSVKGVLENNLSRPNLFTHGNEESSEVQKENKEKFENLDAKQTNVVDESNIVDIKKENKEKFEAYTAEKITFNSSIDTNNSNVIDNKSFDKKENSKTIVTTPNNIKDIIDIEFDEDDEKIVIKEDTDAKLSSYEKKPIPNYKIKGEFFDMYIIVEVEDKIVLIDKHAAHERINFEKMKEQMSKSKRDVQMLLVSDAIVLSSQEIQYVIDYLNDINSIGFDCYVEANELIINGIPDFLELSEAKELLENIINNLTLGRNQVKLQSNLYFEKMLYSAACKASIKGSKHYSEEHLKWIVDNVFMYDCLKNCPHGRTIAFEMTKYDLDKTFGRVGD